MAVKTREKKVYTTGEIARLLGVNINTVIRWITQGVLQGFKLPLSNDRRVTAASLRQFMVQHALPVDLLEAGDGPARRQTVRVPCDHPVEFTARDGKLYGPFPARIADLSRGGARLVVDQPATVVLPFEVGVDSVVLEVNITEGELAAAKLPARVVHLQAQPKAWSIGLQFLPLEEQNSARLRNYLEQRLA